MIWDSVLLMSLFDIGVVILVVALAWVVIAHDRRSAHRVGGVVRYLPLLGLGFIAVFYLVDLTTMLVLPGVLGHEQAMALMHDLHFNLSWPVILFAGLLIGIGYVGLIRRSTETMSRLIETEQEEKYARRRMEDFANAASDWFWETDAEQRYTWFSERVEEFTNFPRDWHYGKTREELGVPDIDPEVWLAHLDDLRNHRPYRNFEYLRRAPDGERWVSSSGVPVFDEEGTFRGYRGVGTDITPRKLAARENERTEQNFRHVVENSIQGLLIHENWAPVFANEAFARIFGYETAEEVLALGTVDPLIHPEEVQRLKDYRDVGLREGGLPGRLRWRGRRKDGSTIWIESTGNLVEWSGRSMLLAAVVDVSGQVRLEEESRQAAERLKENETLLRSVIDNSPNMIAIRDLEGRIVMANLAFQEALGRPDEELVGESIEAVFPSQAAEDLLRRHREVIETGEVHVEEFLIPLAEGEKTVLTVRYPISDADGNTVMVGLASTDISDRKSMELDLVRAKETAEAANRAKSSFLARMSHDLRTPLNAVIGFGQMLRGQILGPLGAPKYLEYAEDIVRSGEYLLSMVNDILDMTRIEAGQYDLVPVDCDLREAADEAIRLITQVAADKRLKIESRIDDDACLVFADRRALRQILINLLSNAGKFTPAGGEVAIEARLGKSGRVEVAVTDTGIGMTPDDAERAVEPFSTVSAVSDLAGPNAGTGLGLSIVKWLVEAHEGELVIDSQPGVGTRVGFSFAVGGEAASAPRATGADRAIRA